MTENKVYKKYFSNRGQMTNYFVKVKNNPNIENVFAMLDAKEGYMIVYTYKKNKKNA